MVDVEGLAISALDDRLGYIDRLKTYTTKRDTQPIWDGCINVYKDNSQRKDNLIKAVPVQVKGDTKQAIKKNTIYYPIDIADLKGFMTTDGAIYFVVGIDKQTRNKKIYYTSLLPIKIAELLKNISDEQQTKNVQLKAFPETDDEIFDIFLNFIHDSNKQSNVKEIGIISLTDLESKKEVHHIEFGCMSSQKNWDILDMLGQEFCIYAVNAVGVSYPLNEAILTQIKNELPQKVSCNNIDYYNKITLSHTTGVLNVSLGNSLSIKYIKSQKDRNNNIRIEFDAQGTVKERLHDINFFIALATRQDIYLDNKFIFKLPEDFKWEKDLSEIEGHKNYLELLAKTMELAGIPDENISFDELNKDCAILANSLIHVFFKKEQSNISPSPEEDVSYGLLRIEGIHLVVLVKKLDNQNVIIENFFTADIDSIISDLDNQEYPSSRYVLLKKEHFLYARNINYENLYINVTKVRMNSFYYSRVTLLLLEMLKAYDTKKDLKLLDVAEKIAIWLLENQSEDNKNISIINLLQIKQRKETITEQDKNNVLDILTSSTNEQFKAACFILLNMPENAQKIINAMSEEERNIFIDYPIYHLLEKHS